MKTQLFKSAKFIALAAVLPFIYGCGAGSGTGSLVGFLFGGGVSGGELALLTIPGGGPGGGGLGASLPTLTNPEPASMLLVGGGLMVMGFFRSKKHSNCIYSETSLDGSY